MMNGGLSVLWQDFKDTLSVGFRSGVASNAASLYLLQVANYMLPLITVPYLVRVLGPVGYGAVAFSQSLIAYLMLFVEYGFDWSATRTISVNRTNARIVNRTALHVWAAKGLLCVVSLGALMLLVVLVPKLREVAWLLLALYGLVLGNVFFPTWLFQGMERMTAISLINLAMKLAVLIGVFGLVRRPEDAVVYAWLMGGTSVAAGLTGMVLAIWVFGLRPSSVSWAGIQEALREGWVLFLSRASMSLYTAGNAFILGMLTNHTVVGYYSAAEKIVRSVLGLLWPIAQAAYPRFSRVAAKSKKRAMKWGRRMLAAMGGISFLLTVGVLWSAPLISGLLLGPGFAPSIAVMRVLAPIIFLIALSNILGVQLMLPLGEDRAFALVLFGAGLLNVVFAILLAPAWGALGMGIAVLVSELFVTAAMFVYLHIDRVSLLTRIGRAKA
jgi:PST family polysaccharide transporter